MAMAGAGMVYRPARPVGSGCQLRSLGGSTTRTRAAGCVRAGLGKTGATEPERRLPRTAPHAPPTGDDHDGTAVIKPSGSSDRASVNSLPCEHGHGLWVVQQVADQMQSLSGPGGTSVLVRFDRGAMRHFA